MSDLFHDTTAEQRAEIDPLTEAWARALCRADGGKPDELIGMPAGPRWRSWVNLAGRAQRAAVALGYSRP